MAYELCVLVVCGVVWCGVVWCGAMRCDAMRCGAVRCGAVRCDATRRDATRHGSFVRRRPLYPMVADGADGSDATRPNSAPPRGWATLHNWYTTGIILWRSTHFSPDAIPHSYPALLCGNSTLFHIPQHVTVRLEINFFFFSEPKS